MQKVIGGGVLGRKYNEFKKASVMGIEPTTFGLGGRCSTIELHGLCLPLSPRPVEISVTVHPIIIP